MHEFSHLWREFFSTIGGVGSVTQPLPFSPADLMAAVVWWLRDGENEPKGILARLLGEA